MVLIALNSYKDKDSLGLYELPEGSLIIDLKAEIEATEGIQMGHQRLRLQSWECVKDSPADLKDNESLDSLISDGSFKVIIYLYPARIICRFKRPDIGCNENGGFQWESEDPEDVIQVNTSVNLDVPIRNCPLWFSLSFHYFGSLIPDPYVATISVLGSDGQPTSTISDIDRSFSYYGVCNGDTVYIVYVPWKTRGAEFQTEWHKVVSAWGSARGEFLSHHSPIRKRTIVRAKYDWNGEIMHPNIKGLSLKHTALFAAFDMSKDRYFKHSPGWLYGSLFEANSFPSFLGFAKTVEGYFPENFVSPVAETIEQDVEVTSTEILDIQPELPPFHFPPASGMSFRMPISDKGYSFLKFTANYECVSSPIDPTHVTISLLCTTHDIRRVSAVTVFITIPESNLLDVQVCENEAHQKEIHTDKEVTETQSKGAHFDGISVGTHGTTIGLQGGVSKSYSIGGTEKGQKISRRKVTAGIDSEDTIFWNLKAPSSKLDEDGLEGEESITLVLKKKPVAFKYKCRVTHARNGVEKTTQRITDKSWLKLF